MVRPLVRLVRTVERLATGIDGNRRHTIGRRVNLVSVFVGGGGSQPPIRAALVLGDFPGQLTALKTGWVRSPSTPGASMSLTWDGRIPTPKDNEWEVVLLWENDTGREVEIVFVHIEEDIP